VSRLLVMGVNDHRFDVGSIANVPRPAPAGA
jgi:hypothetical protein